MGPRLPADSLPGLRETEEPEQRGEGGAGGRVQQVREEQRGRSGEWRSAPGERGSGERQGEEWENELEGGVGCFQGGVVTVLWVYP